MLAMPVRNHAILAALAAFAALSAPAASALDIELAIGSASVPGIPGTLTDVRLACDLREMGSESISRKSTPTPSPIPTPPANPGTSATECRDGTLRARWNDQPIEARIVRGRLQSDGAWSVEARAALRKLTFSTQDGRMATDSLDADLTVTATGDAHRIDATFHADLPKGQAYVDPVFVDFATATATLDAHALVDLHTKAIRLDPLRLDQRGVVRVHGAVALAPGGKPNADLQFDELKAGPAFATYVQPFLAGTRAEKAVFDGRVQAHAIVKAGEPQSLDVRFDGVGVDVPAPELGLRGIEGDLHWQATGGVEPTRLRWGGARYAKLALDGAAIEARLSGRDFTLLSAPLRIPVAGGALVVHELAVQRAGAADMAARFDGEIEPIDLAALCDALGWPAFGGQLAGRLPGVHLENGRLDLDGALEAHAFDGTVTVDGLTMLDPFGRVPRLLANIRARNLDLAAVTGAFSFGKIEGRLDGDVEGLRLLDWEPVEFRARLGTPKGDDSKHRISQRAIDNISSIGGGPTGVLSRGALRFFKTFAYDRIGWSCELRDGVCRMGGLEPAKGGGYVLVKGRLLPRIDVVGYETQVDWPRFLEQLRAARSAQGIEVRR